MSPSTAAARRDGTSGVAVLGDRRPRHIDGPVDGLRSSIGPGRVELPLARRDTSSRSLTNRAVRDHGALTLRVHA
jgi:hypothetical protein